MTEPWEISPDERVYGKSLAELALRRHYGTTVLAIRRHGESLVNPGGEVLLMANDLAMVLGRPEQLASLTSLSARPGSVPGSCS